MTAVATPATAVTVPANVCTRIGLSSTNLVNGSSISMPDSLRSFNVGSNASPIATFRLSVAACNRISVISAVSAIVSKALSAAPVDSAIDFMESVKASAPLLKSVTAPRPARTFPHKFANASESPSTYSPNI